MYFLFCDENPGYFIQKLEMMYRSFSTDVSNMLTAPYISDSFFVTTKKVDTYVSTFLPIVEQSSLLYKFQYCHTYKIFLPEI